MDDQIQRRWWQYDYMNLAWETHRLEMLLFPFSHGTVLVYYQHPLSTRHTFYDAPNILR